MIAIVDYGAGNLRSVAKAIDYLGYPAVITQKATEILDSKAVILPGVGAAADTMRSLQALNLVDALRRVFAEDRPYLGICLGLQVLLTASEEGGHCPCLDIVPGLVRRFPDRVRKIPHMGWNQVEQVIEHPIFEGIPNGAEFYFVHSYFVDPDEKSLIAAETEYDLRFCSVLVRGNLIATQFHPEKSGTAGLRFFENFCRRALE